MGFLAILIFLQCRGNDMTASPTNLDLKQSFDAHAMEDVKFQQETRLINKEMALFKAETEGSLAAIHARLDTVATKEDVKELKKFLDGVRIGTGIFSFTFQNASRIGSFVMVIIALSLVVKYGVFGAVAWILGKNL